MKRDFWRRVSPDRAIRRQLEAENLELGYQVLKQKNRIQQLESYVERMNAVAAQYEEDITSQLGKIEQLKGYVERATEAVGQFQARVLEQDREIEQLRLIVDQGAAVERILRGESGHDGEQASGAGGVEGRPGV